MCGCNSFQIMLVLTIFKWSQDTQVFTLRGSTVEVDFTPKRSLLSHAIINGLRVAPTYVEASVVPFLPRGMDLKHVICYKFMFFFHVGCRSTLGQRISSGLLNILFIFVCLTILFIFVYLRFVPHRWPQRNVTICLIIHFFNKVDANCGYKNVYRRGRISVCNVLPDHPFVW